MVHTKNTKIALRTQRKSKLMAKLINCKTCDNKIASDADRCPHCGGKTTHGIWSTFCLIIIQFLCTFGLVLAVFLWVSRVLDTFILKA